MFDHMQMAALADQPSYIASQGVADPDIRPRGNLIYFPVSHIYFFVGGVTTKIIRWPDLFSPESATASDAALALDGPDNNNNYHSRIKT